MQKKEKIKRGIYIMIPLIFIFSIFVMLSVATVSAGWLDWLKKITGKASSQPTNVSITISGVNPAQVEYVSTISAVDLNEGPTSSTPVTFNVYMTDTDGVADLNDTSVQANFSRSGEALRENNSCALVGDIDSDTANYSCTIDLWYWDENGDWNVTVRGKDLGNETWAYNTSTTFTVNLKKAMVISPSELTWPAVNPGDTNINSSNDPTLVNNTGNYNSTIDVTGINLLGESDPGYSIPVANFTTNISDSCTGTSLSNNTAQAVANTIANRGNLSAGGGAGQEQVYYCLVEVPSTVSSQTYSTDAGGSWTIAYP